MQTENKKSGNSRPFILASIEFLVKYQGTMAKLTIHGAPASTYVRAVRLLLEEAVQLIKTR